MAFVMTHHTLRRNFSETCVFGGSSREFTLISSLGPWPPNTNYRELPHTYTCLTKKEYQLRARRALLQLNGSVENQKGFIAAQRFR